MTKESSAVATMAKDPKTTVRLSVEALKWARIASGYTGESVAEYISRLVEDQGRKDVDRYHAELAREQPKSKGGK